MTLIVKYLTIYWLMAVVFILILAAGPGMWLETGPGPGSALADTDLDAKWNTLREHLENRHAQSVTTRDEKWRAAKQTFQAKWEARNRQILKKWQTAARSSKKIWVAYENQLTSRSQVDFENGIITLETVVETSDPKGYETAERAIKHLGKTLFSRKDKTGETILKDQVKTHSGNPVDEKEIQPFLDQEVIPKITAQSRHFIPDDGIKRRLFKAEIDMVPQHLRIRAEKYLDLVKKHAGANQLDPRLVLAVIHTESYFNPRAVSSSNAIGLMQIIPRYAGREAYRKIYNKDRIMPHAYYFDPEANIQAGCTYLSLLKYKYFKQISDPLKNRYVSICAYNWGPTAMRKKIIQVHDLNAMDTPSVFNLLRQAPPEETRTYILRVTRRIQIYDPYF